MKLSCGFPPSRNAVEYAKIAEDLGFERVYFYDSPAVYGDIWMTLGRAAEATSRIGLGTAVIIPSLRHVLATASAIASVEQLAPGRLLVAIGTGYTGRVMLGKTALSWNTVERYVNQLRGLLRGDVVEVDGSAVGMVHGEIYAPARPIETPLVIAANGPKGIEIAKRSGDGVMCAGVVPEGIQNAIYLCFSTVADSQEDLASERFYEAASPAVALAYHGAWQGSPEAVDNLPNGKAWREEMEQFPEAQRYLHVHTGHACELNEIDRRHITPEIVSQMAPAMSFAGTADQLRERAATLESQGVDEIVLSCMGPDIPGGLRRLKDALG